MTEYITQDNGDGSVSVVPAELPMAEWEQMRPVRRHHLQQRVWTAGAEDSVADRKPRCLARRFCALIFFMATGCGRGFAKP
jgi:hypothetical protein